MTEPRDRFMSSLHPTLRAGAPVFCRSDSCLFFSRILRDSRLEIPPENRRVWCGPKSFARAPALIRRSRAKAEILF